MHIGNPNAEHTIIKVCNIYYGPCVKAHRNGELNEQRDEIDKMRAWCDEAEIIRRGEHQRFM